ncbi:MAG: glycosyltransferase family 2 protein [Pseudomonadota bacterium]
MIELTILMPCLNEARTIGACIEKANRFLEKSGVDGEVLIADNGSTDGSQTIAAKMGARIINVETRGYGAALIAGINAARGRFVIMGDCDESYDFLSLDAFLHELRVGTDLVMGNRFKGGIEAGAMPKLHRYLGNPVLSKLGRMFYRVPIGDFHCGLRGFAREPILGLGLSNPGMEFASEMVIKAAIAGLTIAEVPTTLSPDGRDRAPHLRSWPDGWRHLKLLLTLAPKWLFFYPGMVLFMIGFIPYSILLLGPVSVGAVTFDIATLVLSSALVLVGFQTLSFYFLARIHSVTSGVLPRTESYEWLSQRLSVDRCCQIGVLLLVAAVVSALWSITIWWMAGWGDLSPSVIARPASFVLVCSALGIQCIMSGFLGGFLGLELSVAVSETDEEAEAV